MQTSSETPILIVGGGAAGSILSLELARRGVEARTVDRLAAPNGTSRAINVQARTAELLERIDKDLIRRYTDYAIHNKGYILHFVKNGKRSEVRPGLDFTTVDCRYPYILINGQADTEAFINDYLREKYGRETEWNTKLVDVKQDSDGITAVLVKGGIENDRELVRCRYLVACDGMRSRVRETLGLSQTGSDYQGTILQNLDAFIDDFPDVEDYVHYCVGDDHFVMVVRMPRGYFRMLLSDRGEAADPDITPQQAFQDLLDQHFDGARIADTVWHSKWESWVRLADTYRSGNIFLAGDSAHVHSTAGGQGMNCCMQDAFNLGWKLAMVEQGLVRPELLDSYEAERRPIAEQVIWAASALHEVFMGHGKDVSERSKRINDPEFLDAIVGRCTGISYTYRDYVDQPKGLTPLPGPAIGDRAPDVDLEDGTALFDLIRHPDFTLLAFGGEDGIGELERIGRCFGDRYDKILRSHALPRSKRLERYYGRHDKGRLYLIRPDGYIGYRCLATEADRLGDHLQATFGV